MGTGYYLCLPLEVFYSRNLHEYRIWQFQVQWEQKDDHPDITATNELAYLEIFYSLINNGTKRRIQNQFRMQ